ncbi:hypothetical protein MP228_002680 [Amoeboaphelidium protococcarum]|nr:hypothetical protein MP228_002680 [Amoeboaphelidium protococcarum]
MMSLAQALLSGGDPQSSAIRDVNGGSLTFGEMKKVVNTSVQKIKQLRVSPSNSSLRATLIFGNTIDYVVSFLALTEAGYAVNPLNPQYRYKELEFYIDDVKPSVVFMDEQSKSDAIVKLCQQKNLPLYSVALMNGNLVINNVVNSRSFQVLSRSGREQFNVALLLHTSGTTSRPKCVPLSHNNLITSAQNIAKTYQLNNKDVSFVVMPLFHVHGLVGALFSTLISGGCAVMSIKFHATSFWKDFLRFNCSWYSAVPTIHQILLRHEQSGRYRNVGRLRFVRSCSSALSPATMIQLEHQFRVPVLQAYAMTECSHQMTSNPLLGLRKPGSVGVPQGVQCRIHEGEVVISAPTVTDGYLNNEKANRESFLVLDNQTWFRTGDQGYIDKQGYLFLTGRLKELINRGGEKISPLEIDNVLLSCPGVSDAVTFPLKDDIYGESVNAAVILHPAQREKITVDVLRQHCFNHLSAFKIPQKIFIVDDFPRTATGKIQRRIVSEHFANIDLKTKSKL